MPEQDRLPGEVPWRVHDDLARQMHRFEERLARIESLLGLMPVEPVLPDSPIAKLATALSTPARFVPVFGRALLGIAGGYFLRALTEMGILPVAAGVAAGIVYAVAWMAFAARALTENRLEVGVRSVTSVLLLAPLVWEATLRFHALSTWTAAGVLAGFTILGLAVSWRKNVTVLAWIALLAGTGTAWALLVGTRDVLPFTLAVLAMAAGVEASACLEHWLPERWVGAIGANLATLLLTYLTTLDVLPQGYAALPAAAAPTVQAALLGIYLTSTIVRTLARGFPFTFFETAQCATAFLIGVGGAMVASGGSGLVAVAMPAFTLLCGGACYLVSFAYLERRGKHDRNFCTYSSFGLLLVLAGTWMLLSGTVLALAWSALALASMAAGGGNRVTLKWHGVLYLLLAVLISGLGMLAGTLLLGSGVGLSGISPGGWLTALAVATCYLVARRHQRETLRGPIQFGFLQALAAILIWNLSGMAAGILTGLYSAPGESERSVAYLATLRTTVITLGSIGLAWTGTRWMRPELSRLVYPLMTLGAYKLVTQDFAGDQTMALFLSLLLYGGALTWLPRLLSSR